MVGVPMHEPASFSCPDPKLFDAQIRKFEAIKHTGFFQYYYPEVNAVYPLKKYGYNLRSQLLKLLVVFPAVSALVAWICTLLA